MILGGIRDIADRYDTFILDLWGVIHNGMRAYPGVPECLEMLKSQGKQILLLSNSPHRAWHIAGKLHEMGVPSELYDHLVSSGELTHIALRERSLPFTKKLGRRYYDFWRETDATTMKRLDYERVENIEDAEFVLGALIDSWNLNTVEDYEETLAQALKKKLPLICANPDLLVNHGDEIHLCPGSIAQRYEEMGGTTHWFGKPFTETYAHCHEILGHPDKKRMLAVGDSIRTDIQGAENFGIDSIFNLIGIHWEEVQMDHAPHQADIAKVAMMLVEQTHQPTYTLCGFNW